MIIGFAGFAGSGKDTAANYFVEEHGFKKIAFADSVKDTLAAVFNWDRTLLAGITPESREWRNTVDVWWSNKLNIPDFTPRKAMQLVGTDLFRDKFNSDIWVSSLENKLKNTSGSIVVSDVRFPNEIQMIKSLGGTVYGIHRGVKPEWLEYAYIFNTAPRESNEWLTAADLMKQVPVHESEYMWITNLIDSIIINDTTTEELYSILKTLMI